MTTFQKFAEQALVEAVAELVGMIPDDEIDPTGENIEWGRGAEPAEGAPVFVSDGWTADDGNAEVEYPHATSGREAAEEYVEDGDWGETESTTWVRVRTWRVVVSVDSDGEEIRGELDSTWRTITVDPEEPECLEDETHEWASDHEVVGGCESNPGVQGHGGGVVIREHCRHCGVYRVIDTWAQDPETGAQGLRSTSYELADAASRRATDAYEALHAAATATLKAAEGKWECWDWSHHVGTDRYGESCCYSIDETVDDWDAWESARRAELTDDDDHTTETARDCAAAQRAYGEEAQGAAESADEARGRALEALERRDLEAALAAIREAASAESEYGDCPVYRPCVDATKALYDWAVHGEVA